MTSPTTSQESSRSDNASPTVESYQIPANTYISQNPSDRFVGVVGAAVIIYHNRVLLLQRAADDDCPNLWEIPGGAANDDEIIIDCVVRELWEEAGLRASNVTAMLGEFEWVDSSPLPGRGKWKIFIFRVTVTGDDSENLEVTLDPDEHKGYVWATKDEVRDDLCGDVKLEWVSLNQKKTILNAF